MNKYSYNTEDWRELVKKLENFENYSVYFPGLTSETAEVYLKEVLYSVIIEFYKKYNK